MVPCCTFFQIHSKDRRVILLVVAYEEGCRWSMVDGLVRFVTKTREFNSSSLIIGWHMLSHINVISCPAAMGVMCHHTKPAF